MQLVERNFITDNQIDNPGQPEYPNSLQLLKHRSTHAFLGYRSDVTLPGAFQTVQFQTITSELEQLRYLEQFELVGEVGEDWSLILQKLSYDGVLLPESGRIRGFHFMLIPRANLFSDDAHVWRNITNVNEAHRDSLFSLFSRIGEGLAQARQDPTLGLSEVMVAINGRSNKSKRFFHPQVVGVSDCWQEVPIESLPTVAPELVGLTTHNTLGESIAKQVTEEVFDTNRSDWYPLGKHAVVATSGSAFIELDGSIEKVLSDPRTLSMLQYIDERVRKLFEYNKVNPSSQCISMSIAQTDAIPFAHCSFQPAVRIRRPSGAMETNHHFYLPYPGNKPGINSENRVYSIEESAAIVDYHMQLGSRLFHILLPAEKLAQWRDYYQ